MNKKIKPADFIAIIIMFILLSVTMSNLYLNISKYTQNHIFEKISVILFCVIGICILLNKVNACVLILEIISLILVIPSVIETGKLFPSIVNIFYLFAIIVLIIHTFRIMYKSDDKFLIPFLYSMNKNSWMINYKMSKIKYYSGNITDAIIFAESAKKLGAPISFYGQLLGLYNHKNGNYLAAIDILKNVVNADSTQTKSLYYLADSLYKTNQYQYAINILEKSVTDNNLDYDQQFLLGVCYEVIQEYDKAINRYTLMIENFPNDSYILYNRGKVYDIIEKYELALNDFISATKCVNPDPKSFYALGVYKFENDEIEEAKTLFDKGMKLDPSLIDYIPNKMRNYYE